MPTYYSTPPLYNPLSAPINSRFAVALAAIREPCEAPSDEGRHHNPNSSTYQDFRCHVFDSFLARPPLPCNKNLLPKEIRPGSLQPHYSSVTRRQRHREQVMQSHQDRRDHPTVNDPSFASTAQSGHSVSTGVSILEPYIPPNVPHGLPHVVRIATPSSMDLPPEVRFLIVRLAEVHGLASVANSTPREICRMGSHSRLSRPLSAWRDDLYSGTFLRELRFPGNLRTAGAAAA